MKINEGDKNSCKNLKIVKKGEKVTVCNPSDIEIIQTQKKINK